MEIENQINISHTKNSLIRNYLQLFLYIISISSLFSQVITPQILELDNKIFQLDDNLANGCFADIDEQIDELIKECERINYYVGADFLNALKANRYIAQNNEDALFNLVSEYEGYLSQSVKYGIFDKWFYYKYVLLSLKKITEGFVLVEEEFIIMLDNPEVKRSPTKMFDINTKLWYWSPNGEKKENYYEKIQNILDTNVDLKNSIFFAFFTRESLLQYFGNVTNNVTSNNIYVINKSDITQSKKVLKRRKLENTVDMDMLTSLEALNEYAHQKNLVTLEKSISLYEKTTDKSYLGFGENKWALVFFISNQLGELGEYDSANRFLIKESKGWEKIWDDYPECLSNTMSNDMIMSQVGVAFTEEHLKATMTTALYSIIAENMDKKGDMTGYEKYAIKGFNGLKKLNENYEVVNKALDLAEFYFKQSNKKDGDKYLKEAIITLNVVDEADYVPLALRYTYIVYNRTAMYDPNYYRKVDNVLTKTEELLKDKNDHKNEYWMTMQRIVTRRNQNLDKKITEKYFQHADSLLNNYDFIRIIDADWAMFEYYKKNKDYNKLRKMILENFDFHFLAKNYVDAFTSSINNYYNYVFLQTRTMSDYKGIDSLMTKVEEVITEDAFKTYIKLSKMRNSYVLDGSNKKPSLVMIEDFIDLRYKIVKFDVEEIDKLYIEIGHDLIYILEQHNDNSTIQKLVEIEDDFFWISFEKYPMYKWERLHHIEHFSGQNGEFNENLYFKYYDVLIKNYDLSLDIIKEKFKHSKILISLNRYKEAVEELENLIIDSQNFNSIENELKAYVELSELHYNLNQDELFYKRNAQGISVAKMIGDKGALYSLYNDLIQTIDINNPNFIKAVMGIYDLDYLDSEFNGIIYLIDYYERNNEIDSVYKYINEGINKKSQANNIDYLQFLEGLHSVVVQSNFNEQIGMPIIKVIRGQKNSSEMINKIYSELIILKDYDFKSLDFNKAPYIIYNAWAKSNDLKEYIDKEYVNYDEWYWLTEKLLSVTGSTQKGWGLTKTLAGIQFRINKIEEYPLSNSYLGFGFQYQLRNNNFFITDIFKGPSTNILKVNDQIIVSEDVKTREDMKEWLVSKVKESKNGKPFLIDIVRANNDNLSFKLVPDEIQTNPYSKDPRNEVKILMEFYDNTYDKLDEMNFSSRKISNEDHKRYLAFYPWRYSYTTDSWLDSEQNINLLNKYETTSTNEFINKTLMHKNTIDNNSILFDEYNRISTKINSVQIQLQKAKLDNNQINDLFRTRESAYNELKYFEDYNLERVNPSNESFSFNQNLSLFNQYDRVIKYASAPPSLNYAFAWRKDTNKMFASYSSSEKRLSVLVKTIEQALRYDLENPNKSNRLQETLIDISKAIIGEDYLPISKKKNLEYSDVLIATEGSMNFFPYELIQVRFETDTTKFHYYGEFANITYTPSLSAFSKLNQQKNNKVKNKSLLVSSNPNTGNTENYLDNLLTFRSNIGNIKYVDIEIDNIDKTLSKRKGIKKGFENTVLKSNKITEKNFKSLNLSQYKYIHIAAHGVHDIEKPQYSGLLLGRDEGDNEDGILQSHEIFPLKLNADLVTLSSCFSGFGEIDKIEGNLGIYRTFLIAGAKSVIISLWDVEDESTSILFTKFYELLKSGKSKSESLRLAKMYLKNGTRFDHPFYWAPFVLIGES